MNKFSSIWVFSDTPSRLPELMKGAQALGDKVNTFVLSDADSATACHLGADHVWLLSGKPEDRMVEEYADVMAQTIRQHSEGGAVRLQSQMTPAQSRCRMEKRRSNIWFTAAWRWEQKQSLHRLPW